MHEHGHGHYEHHPGRTGKPLFWSIILNIGITVAQIIGGVISGSLALLSDALHNFSDVLSLVMSYGASRLARKKASKNKTFGYKRAEIIAAFVNSATLIIVAVLLIIEAVKRFQDPQEIGTGLVIWLSLLAIFGNGFSVLIMRSSADYNMNMRSAYLHLFTDMLASVAVFIGGILMKFFALYWIDPLLTVVIALYLIYVGYDLLRASTRVLMLFTPETIEVNDIVTSIASLDAVKNVHHVHIWQLNEQEVHLEAHIDFNEDIRLSTFDEVLQEIEERVYQDFGINHVNIQPEFGKCDSKKVIVQD